MVSVRYLDTQFCHPVIAYHLIHLLVQDLFLVSLLMSFEKMGNSLSPGKKMVLVEWALQQLFYSNLSYFSKIQTSIKSHS